MHTHKPTLTCHNTFNTIGLVSLSAFTLLSLYAISPTCFNNTHAETPLTSTVNSAISIALEQPTDINLTPTVDGQFGSTSGQLQVSADYTGYKLYINTLDASNAMLNTNNTQDAQIAALPSATTSNNFPHNTWGYSLTTTPTNNTTVYNPMPKTSTLAYDTDQTTGTHFLSFAANIDTSLPAGSYANTVLVSAIANPRTVTDLTNAIYMQDMTSSICNNTKSSNGSATVALGNEPTKQLIDVRDGKQYWVAKLADQNCWMTQNLALDLTAGKVLNSTTTNLISKSTWLIPEDTSNQVPPVDDSIDYNLAKSWNLGQYVLAVPDRGVFCDSAPITDSPNNQGSNSVRPGQTISQNCSDFVNVSEGGWQPTFDSKSAPTGTWTGTNYNYSTQQTETYTYTGPLTVDKNSKTYDAHYLIGNYYSWNAAVAGSGGSNVISPSSAIENANALTDVQDSICPKNWTLPKGGRNSNTGHIFNRDHSFYQLLLTYGYPTTDKYNVSKLNGYTGILTGTTNGAHQNPVLSPLYYVHSGSIQAEKYGSLRNLGYASNSWTSTAYFSSLNAFYYNFHSTSIYPSSDENRSRGLSIRCLVQ